MPPDRWAIVPVSQRERREYVGAWAALKYRRRAKAAGVRAVASQLRRQGVPLDVALRILGIVPTAIIPPSPIRPAIRTSGNPHG